MSEMFGKYAEFIVPAFGITAWVFALMVIASLRYSRRWKRRYEELTRKDAGQ